MLAVGGRISRERWQAESRVKRKSLLATGNLSDDTSIDDRIAATIIQQT
jgi:hypothetical protein